MSSLTKTILVCISVLIVIVIFWSHYSSPIDNFRLVTQSIVAKGYIVKAEEFEEEVEENDGRRAGIRTSTYYEYHFTLPNGKQMKDGDILRDDMPDYLMYVKYNPYPVTIQYLEKNPKVNKVKELSEIQNIGQWFRKSFFFGFLILCIASSLAYKIIKDAYKEDLLEKKEWEDYKNKNSRLF